MRAASPAPWLPSQPGRGPGQGRAPPLTRAPCAQALSLELRGSKMNLSTCPAWPQPLKAQLWRGGGLMTNVRTTRRKRKRRETTPCWPSSSTCWRKTWKSSSTSAPPYSIWVSRTLTRVCGERTFWGQTQTLQDLRPAACCLPARKGAPTARRRHFFMAVAVWARPYQPAQLLHRQRSHSPLWMQASQPWRQLHLRTEAQCLATFTHTPSIVSPPAPHSGALHGGSLGTARWPLSVWECSRNQHHLTLSHCLRPPARASQPSCSSQTAHFHSL